MKKYYGKVIELTHFTIKGLDIETEFEFDILQEEYVNCIKALNGGDPEKKVPVFKIAKHIHKNDKVLEKDLVDFMLKNVEDTEDLTLFEKLSQFYLLYLQFNEYRHELKKK